MYIAVDIGGTKTLVAAFSQSGDLLRSSKTPTDKHFGNFMHNLISAIEEVREDDTIDAICVASPALIDHETGISLSFGNLDWRNVDIVSPLKDHFVPDVYIDNDAKLGALGEANMGAGIGYEKVLYITLSTGIGTGVTVDGKIDETLHDIEGGQMLYRHDGKLMIWEKFASGKAFYEEFQTFGSEDNDPEHWREWAEDLSVGILNLISIVQPDVVVIGGSMGEFIDKYHDYLQDAINKSRGPTVSMPVLVGAKYPNEAVINGCYTLCQQRSQA